MPIGWICFIDVYLWKNITNSFWFVNVKDGTGAPFLELSNTFSINVYDYLIIRIRSPTAIGDATYFE